MERSTPDEVKLLPCEGAHNWEVGPCVNRLGHVTSWDINIRPREGDKGVVVIASVYSGEETARAILAAIQASVEHPLARMVRLDEEMGLYDDEPIEATRPPIGTDEVVERVARAIYAATVQIAMEDGNDLSAPGYDSDDQDVRDFAVKLARAAIAAMKDAASD